MRSSFRNFLPYLLLIALLVSGYIYVTYIAVPDVDRSDATLDQATAFRGRLSSIQNAPKMIDLKSDQRYEQLIDLLSVVPQQSVGRTSPFSQ